MPFYEMARMPLQSEDVENTTGPYGKGITTNQPIQPMIRFLKAILKTALCAACASFYCTMPDFVAGPVFPGGFFRADPGGPDLASLLGGCGLLLLVGRFKRRFRGGPNHGNHKHSSWSQ